MIAHSHLISALIDVGSFSYTINQSWIRISKRGSGKDNGSHIDLRDKRCCSFGSYKAITISKTLHLHEILSESYPGIGPLMKSWCLTTIHLHVLNFYVFITLRAFI